MQIMTYCLCKLTQNFDSRNSLVRAGVSSFFIDTHYNDDQFLNYYKILETESRDTKFTARVSANFLNGSPS